MDEYEDLDVHNGDAEHDMWVDFDYNENSGELSDIFEDADSDNYSRPGIDLCASSVGILMVSRHTSRPFKTS